jgi:hypothetical protein
VDGRNRNRPLRNSFGVVETKVAFRGRLKIVDFECADTILCLSDVLDAVKYHNIPVNAYIDSMTGGFSITWKEGVEVGGQEEGGDERDEDWAT